MVDKSGNKYISLTEAANETPYSQEYLSLRARQGKLKAVKFGRNWVTKKEWVEEYIKEVNGDGANGNRNGLSDKAVNRVQKTKDKVKKQEQYISLSKAQEYSGYSQEYLSLRARQGKIKAIKIGRNWVTKKEWIDKYKNRLNKQKKTGANEIIKLKLPELKLPKLKAPKIQAPEFSRIFVKRLAAVSLAAVLILTSLGVAFGHPLLKPVSHFAFNAVDTLTEAVSYASSGSQKFLSNATGFISTSANEFAEQVDSSFNNISKTISSISNTLSSKPKNILSNIVAGGLGIKESIGISLKNISKKVNSFTSNINNNLALYKDGFIAQLKELSFETENINVGFSILSERAIKSIKQEYGFISNKLKDFKLILATNTSALIAQISETSIEIAKFVSAQITNGTQQAISSTSQTTKTATETIVRSIKKGIEGTTEGVIGVAETLGTNTKALTYSIGDTVSTGFSSAFRFITSPWRKKEQVLVTIEPEDVSTTTEIIVKETVKQVEVSTVTQPIKEIVRETQTTKIDSQELVNLKIRVGSLEEVTSKLRNSPPNSQAPTAPIYIGSSGIQSTGIGTFTGLGVSGSGAFQSLSVKDGLTVGLEAQDIFTIRATSNFYAPTYMRDGLTIGTKGTLDISSTSSPQLRLGHKDIGYLTAGVDLSGNLTMTSTAGDYKVKFATTSAYSIYQGETIRFAIATSGYTGIGTTSPQEYFTIYNQDSTRTADILRIASTTYSALVIDRNGNLGVGTIAPQERFVLSPDSNLTVEMASPVNITLTTTSGGSLATSTYYFKIVALDGVGTTIGSTEASTTADLNEEINLAWTGPQGASSYRIYFSTTSGAQARYFSTTSAYFGFKTSADGTVGTVPTVTTAYATKIATSSNSWFLGGNIGIGTSTPYDKFVVAGDVHITGTLSSGSTASAGNITMGTGNWVGLGSSAGRITFTDAGTDTLTLEDANIGIGTTTASSLLTVAGDGSLTGGITVDGTSTLATTTITDLQVTGELTLSGAGIALDTLNVSTTSTLATTVLTVLEASGEVFLMSNVGIATTSPTYRLETTGTSTAGFFGVSQNTAGDIFTIDNSGNVGIGIDAPEALFHTAKTNTYNNLYMDTYDNGITYSRLNLRRSDTDTLGTASQTDDTDILGELVFWGVDSGNNFDNGAYIQVVQDGAASGKVPTKMRFVTYSDSGANSEMVLDASGDLGVATTSPIYRLETVGTSTAGFFGVWQNSAGDLFVVDNSGNVGIGTSTPTEQLELVAGSGRYQIMDAFFKHFYAAESFPRWQINRDAGGSGKAGVEFGSGGSAVDSNLYRNAANILRTGDTLIVDNNLGVGTTSPTYRHEVVGTSTAGFFGVSQNSAGDLFVIDNSGNVGIGTDSPSEKLQVATEDNDQGMFSGFGGVHPGVVITRAGGTIASPSAVSNGSSLGRITFQGYDVNSYTEGAMIRAEVDGTPGDQDMPGRLLFLTTADDNSSVTTRMTINSSGNVGVGTTTPNAHLAVYSDGTQALTTDFFRVGTSSQDYFIVDNNGDIGISSSTPATLFVVAGTSTMQNVMPAADNTYYLGSAGKRWANIYAVTTTIGSSITIDSNNIRGSGQTDIIAAAASTWETTSGDLTLQSANTLFASSSEEMIFVASGVERMRIASTTGNVGIGTSTPDILFVVDGAANFDSTVGITGALTLDSTLSATGATSTLATTSIALLRVSDNFVVTGTSTLATTTLTALEAASLVHFKDTFEVDATSTLATTTMTWAEVASDGHFRSNLIVDGNVGIATTSPKYRLETVGTSTDGFFGVSQNTAGDLFAINNNGYVGIGTDSPSQELDIAGDVAINGTTRITNIGNFSILNTLEFDPGEAGQIRSNNGSLRLNASGYSDNILMVCGGGSVGINTTGPDRKLDILDASNPQLRLTHTDGSVYVEQRATSTGDWIVESNIGKLLVIDSQNNNTFLGEDAGTSFIDKAGQNNTAIGEKALDAATSSDDNIAIWTNALSALTAGSLNIAIGVNAMVANTDGSRNIAIGNNVLDALTSGTNNFGFGQNALTDLTTGSQNFGIGNSALTNVVTGSDNIGIGNTALSTNVSGIQNVGIGDTALYTLESGMANTAIGGEAGYYSSSSDNTFIGYQAGYGSNKLFTGQRNTYIGSGAGKNTTSSNNVMIGYQAGRGAASNEGTGGNNTFLGYEAGDNPSGYTGANNILLGYMAGNNIDTGSNNIVLGYDIDIVDPTASNQLNIADLIYADTNVGDVGISTTTPQYKLEVLGTSTAGFFGVSQNSKGDLFVIDNNGDIGIGTSTPDILFVVDGAANFDSTVGITGALTLDSTLSATGATTTLATTSITLLRVSDNFVVTGTSTLATTTLTSLEAASLVHFKDTFEADATTTLATTTMTWAEVASDGHFRSNLIVDGNIGIATITPTYRLETVGTSTAGFFGVSQNTAGDLFTIDNNGDIGVSSTTPATLFVVAGTSTMQNIIPAADNTYYLGSAGRRWANGYFTTTTIGGTITIDSNNIIGSGQTDIIAAAASTWETISGNLTLQSANTLFASSSEEMIFVASGVERVRIASTTGNVGIGTTSPTALLTSYSDATALQDMLTVASTTATYLKVDNVGNVGIGTASPVATLDVRGAIENGLVAWWPMDEGTGSTVNDRSINSNTGTITSASCPSGYILVPGNATYGTSDFCVMQYEAKNDGSGNAISQEGTTPWVSITQTNAITECLDSGGHLITNNEWMTIARNVEQVAANWSGASVGSGCLFRGNNGTADACGYNGSNPEFGSGRDSKASLTLDNDQVIWDFAGNVWEWTNNTIVCAGANCTTDEMPFDATPASEWVEFTDLAGYGELSYDDIRPSDNTYNSAEGMGKIYTDANAASPSGNTHAFRRGGTWNSGANAGAFTLNLSFAPSNSNANVGFRCVR